MFVGRSKISKDVIVKHVQHVGIIWAVCLPRGTCYIFQCLGEQKKLLGYLLLGGNQYPADTMLSYLTPYHISNE